MSLSEYILLALGSLFVIVDPLATMPAFLAMTPNDTPEQRIRTARLACCVTAGVLLAFSVAGQLVFKVMGITMPAFEIAASIVLLLVALDMLRAQRSRVQETHEETKAGTEKTDIAITPLAIPMLAGPGAISTTILLQNEAHDVPQHIALYGCILTVSLASYLVLRIAARGTRWLNPIAMSIATRIMGLLLASVAVQFMLNAIKAFHTDLISPPIM
ncbi:MAG TPA: MarC family protein [Verrucomicrobiae bacterium]|nr:MarC family protein [Verrucomicrobiae bacterium]